MGTSISKQKPEEEPLLDPEEGVLELPPLVLSQREYLPPAERQKRRAIPYKTAGFSHAGDGELGADTYDYVLALPNSNLEEEEEEEEGKKSWFGKRAMKKKTKKITWEEAKAIWEEVAEFDSDFPDGGKHSQLLLLAEKWATVEASNLDEKEIIKRYPSVKGMKDKIEKSWSFTRKAATDKSQPRALDAYAIMKDVGPDYLLTRLNERAEQGKGEQMPFLSEKEWHGVLLRAFIQLLTDRSGLQLKITLSGDMSKVYIRMRAPYNLLLQEATESGYSLQFAWEVDPGYQFWGEEEIEEEKRPLQLKEAKETLQELYNADKLPANELVIDTDTYSGMRLSRKVHVLERKADCVPVTNRFPAYCPYDPSSNYLYQTYFRGRTVGVFTAKDRIRLTKQLMSKLFNPDMLCHRVPVAVVIPLHDANLGDPTTINSLAKSWVYWWRANPIRVGAPFVSMPAMDQGMSPWFFMKPFSQPLDDIRDYFGEKVALYFCWLGFYSVMMGYLALVCLGVYYYLTAHPVDVDPPHLQPWMVFMAIVITVWTSFHSRGWAQQQNIVKVKWGVSDFEEEEECRPQFKGELHLNPVNNQPEKFYPENKRRRSMMLSNSIILCFIVALWVFIVFIYELEKYWLDKGYAWGSLVGSLILSVQIQVLSAFYMAVVDILNDLENHKTQTDFEDGKIFKTFLFQIFNNYASLTYTAFVKTHISGCATTCIGDLRSLMITIFMTSYVMNFVELGMPLLMQKKRQWEEKERMRRNAALADRKQAAEAKLKAAMPEAAGAAAAAASKKGGGGGAEAVREEEAFERELHLEPNAGMFSDYAEMVLQYGSLVLFILAFPAAPILAVTHNIMEIRVDAYKFCKLFQRPDPEGAEDIGNWELMMDMLGWAGVVMNCAIICFTSSALSNYTLVEKVIFFLVFEHALLLLKYLIHAFIDEEPGWLQETIKRQKFVVKKYTAGLYDETPAGIDGPLKMAKGQVDIDDPTFVLETSAQLTAAQFAKLQRRQKQLRDISVEIEKLKRDLYEAYDKEIFNKETGIAETKDGLPLGCVQATLHGISGLEEDGQMMVELDLVSTKGQPKYLPVAESSDWFTTRQGMADFLNQMCTLTPVGTKEAELVMKVHQVAHTGKEGVIGTGKLHLHALEDQMPHQMDIPLLIQRGVRWVDTGVVLQVTLKFLYSKVLPIRQRVAALQAQKREVEVKMFAEGGEDREEEEEEEEKDGADLQSYKSETQTFKTQSSTSKYGDHGHAESKMAGVSRSHGVQGEDDDSPTKKKKGGLMGRVRRKSRATSDAGSESSTTSGKKKKKKSFSRR